MKYRAEIDGLRALAVVPVILFHAGFEIFGGGFVGVDVFFVISGYLITTILIEDIEKKRFSIVSFYERRARRLFPALFFVMLVCIPFAWLWMLPSQVESFSKSLTVVSLFASNILFWRESGYFAAVAKEKPLLHTWSLAVEEQFYVLFPVFLFLFWRFGKQRVFWMIVVMAAISLFLSEWGWRNKPSANFYLAPTRAWELFAGSIAAFIVQKKGVQKNNLLAFLGFAAIIFSIFAYDESTPFPSIYSLVPVLGVVLLVLFAEKETVVAKLLSTKAFVSIGLISYSAYLWHQPLFAFGRIRLENPSLLIMTVLSSIAILLGYFSWKYIEKPFRHHKTVTRSSVFLNSIVGIILFITIGFFGHFSDGYKSYLLNEQQIGLVNSLERSTLPSCKGKIDECLKSVEFEDSKNIILLGDSNAYHFSIGLQGIADELGFSFLPLTFPGCMPLANFYRLEQSPGFNTECISFNSSVADRLSALNNKIDVIVVSAAWLLYFYGDDLLKGLENYSGVPEISNIRLSIDGKNEIREEDREKIFSLYLKHLLSVLSLSANKVILVGPLPPSITRFDNKFSVFNPTLISTEQYLNATSSFSRVLSDALNSYQVSNIDLTSHLCGESVCEIMQDGMFLYGDPTHLSHYGQATIVVPQLSNLLQINEFNE